jgi:glycosyltransferase involved in cell wall biosynthesis
MKVFFYGESPVIDTGAALVSRPLLRIMLDLGWDIHAPCINHFGDVPYDTEEWPITFYSAPEEQYFNLDHVDRLLAEESFDLIFLTGDVNRCDDVMEVAKAHKQRTGAPIVVLGAIDVALEMPYMHHFLDADVLAVYSQFAAQVARVQIPEKEVRCITLGYEPENFYPLDAETRRRVRREAFHIDDDETFLVTIVNRNQYRKDIMHGAYAFHLFHQKYPNSKLYIHAKMKDQGGHLPTQCKFRGLKIDGGPAEAEVYFTQPEYSVVKGFPIAELNKIYNAADVCISTSTGEAWGLTTSECQAAGTPFIGPRHTTFIEHLGENEERGYLTACGGPDLWAINYGKGEEWRPITSCTDMAAKLEHVYLNRVEAAIKAEEARKWAMSHTWTQFTAQWKEILTQVSRGTKEATFELMSTTS